ncbi:MAG: hypothetical protein ACREI7_10145, partial [Myxococcota bacterium]
TGGDPHRADTDEDGIDDRAEPREDCNADGLLAIADGDDDADARIDGHEPAAQRCDADVDRDGLLDGFEGSATCVAAPDCDADGLHDRTERDAGYDPLHSDTFATGLNDAIALAFQRAAQPPSSDSDRDGIPDAWESSTGLIEWGPLRPAVGQRDLLVEFVRVQGPDSARYAYLDLTPAYASVAAVFRAAGIELHWVETVVQVAVESRPHVIPSSTAPYYEDVLGRARLSTNPYVTTVVLNPQHDQSEVAHAGAAPIRGLLAAIDYGYHTTVDFYHTYVSAYRWNVATLEYDPVYATEVVPLSPYLESLAVGGRHDALAAYGFSAGALVNGEVRLDFGDGSLRWRPSWFASAPVVVTPDSSTVLTPGLARIDVDELARTVLH